MGVGTTVNFPLSISRMTPSIEGKQELWLIPTTCSLFGSINRKEIATESTTKSKYNIYFGQPISSFAHCLGFYFVKLLFRVSKIFSSFYPLFRLSISNFNLKCNYWALENWKLDGLSYKRGYVFVGVYLAITLNDASSLTYISLPFLCMHFYPYMKTWIYLS